MVKVGILGANGFIGSRTIEMLLADGVDVFPIVRRKASIARSTVNHLDYRIANALDQNALERAFTGCDFVVHSILGNPGLIRAAIAPAYKAAQRAGVRRLIYLSSMCVHGQNPPPGTTEESILIRQQPFPYNTAKIDAERKLLHLRSQGSVEVVIFRPGVVFGPRSNRVVEIAEQLLNRTACFINGGTGFCNSVYIDNLVHAIRLALRVNGGDGQAFFIGDYEQVTWWDFYRPFAEALGIDPSQIPTIPVPKFAHPSRKQQVINRLRDSEWTQKILAFASEEIKQTIKKALPKRSKVEETNKQQASLHIKMTSITQEMALLQQSQYKLPLLKAEKTFGYSPIVPFSDACDRSIQWLTSDWLVSKAADFKKAH